MNYLIKFLILGVGLLAAGPVLAASIYVYVGPKGDRLITDHLRNDLAGYRLLKKYTADDDFGSPSGPAWSGEVSPRKSRYDALIQSKAQQFGIEAALLKAMIHVESAFNPNAVSPKGAGGLMQLMPATAARYGVSRRFDPVESIEGGSRYLVDLLSMFSYDTRLALAAYNAGEGAVTRYNGIPPYPETENYVEKVMRLRDLYRKGLVGT